jgi:hypothetical protein
MMDRSEAVAMQMLAVAETFNSGAPIPPVNAFDIRQMWDASRRMNAEMSLDPNHAVGLGVYAAYGVEAASTRPEQFILVHLRHSLMSDLVGRGVLNDYMQGEELDEKVFHAAATIPCSKDDWAGVLVQLSRAQSSAGVVEKAKEEIRDTDKPSIDGKFLHWLRDNC